MQKVLNNRTYSFEVPVVHRGSQKAPVHIHRRKIPQGLLNVKTPTLPQTAPKATNF